MIILLIALVLILVASIVWGIKTEWYESVCLTPAVALLGFFALPIAVGLSAKWHLGSQTLSGYVYSRTEKMGYSRYELRFSQNAGQDTQPSFCVKAGSDADKALTQVVGVDRKVNISVPGASLRLANNPFECDSYATFDGEIGEE